MNSELGRAGEPDGGPSEAPTEALRVRLDPPSSARWFDGWKRQATGAERTVTPERLTDPPPVARVRTWLLAVGWRRLGLLDPLAVPG